MQSHDLSSNPCSIGPDPHSLDLPNMQHAVSSPIHHSQPSSPCANEINHKDEKVVENGNIDENGNAQKSEGNENSENSKNRSSGRSTKKEKNSESTIVRRERPARACTVRAVKLYVEPPVIERKPRPAKREKVMEAVVEDEEEEEEEEEEGKDQQGGKIVTQLVNQPPPGQSPRWNLRSMWELASILNFLNIFRPLLNISIELSAEELETALITPNNTLGDIHIPLLKAIPPVTRMACGHDTWVTVLCRKLRDWWHWVADGELPIVASHGGEIEVYKALDPEIRVMILKALCEIRVEQEDVRNYIDDSIKHGAHLSAFRKERIGGDSHGISYWYEDDPVIGHRLYREIRKAEVKKVKMKGSQVLPNASYEWETVATNFEEFQDVSEKLFLSKNRTEASLGKKLKNDMLPEIEKIHKRKEKLLKKQQRQALLLDNFVNMDGLVAGRSLRDRKPVTYTFDDFDRSINEAIKVTKKKQPSPEPSGRREAAVRSEPAVNSSIWSGHSDAPPQHVSFSLPSPDYDEMDEDDAPQQLDRSNRRRQRPQRYSERDYVEEDNEVDFDSDDDIVGEAVYDEEYLRRRKERRKLSSGSEGDEEYHYSEENVEDEEYLEEDSLSISEEEEEEEDSDRPRPPQRLRSMMPDDSSTARRRGTKLRSVVELQTGGLGLRRSKRSTRNRINYRQYEMSESEPESAKRGEKTSFVSAERHHHSDASENEDYSTESQDSEGGGDEDDRRRRRGEREDVLPVERYTSIENEQAHPHPHEQGNNNRSSQDVVDDGVGQQRHFLDLNKVAPGPGFDDGPGVLMKNQDKVLQV
ncbi:hypothetical protein Dimus_004831 [Dionaea muscipula]